MPNNETRHASVAVFGRIPFDDEDTCFVYSDVSVAQAHQRFEDDLYALGTYLSREENQRDNGAAVYINKTLVSSAEIAVQ